MPKMYQSRPPMKNTSHNPFAATGPEESPAVLTTPRQVPGPIAQTSLFDLPAHNGTATSIAAAKAIAPSLNKLQLDVAAFVRERGDFGATREEIMLGTGLKHQTVGPRVLELIARRLLRETEITRKTTTGRVARVLVYSPN